jgi:uracil-DNA glycosylase
MTDKVIFPKKSDIFRIFRLLSPDKIRVVILGQDPYYADENQANGIAFDINPGLS